MAYSPRRVANKGVRAEARLAAKWKVRRVGGPGRPDFVVKGMAVENKHWDRRNVHAGIVRKVHQAGVRVLNSSGRKGFTSGARRQARILGITLTRRR